VHFGLTGEHDIDGKFELLNPDPYGRWVFGANYLTSIPGYDDMGNVASALLQLAQDAGRSGTFAGDPIHDPLKRQLAAALNPREREVYELFAPTTSTHDMVAAGELAKKLATTIAARDPLMDATPYLSRVRIPTILAHGRDDRLVPYTETIRIERALPPALVRRATVTGLFSHSGGQPLFLHPVRLTRELTGLMSLLNDMLTTL
jgi:pimeloyl-ACP methyl ester carboxylesterase